MANVVLYEKPGCGTNARQKRMLELAGHTVTPKNLLQEPWTAERLLAFFGDTPVATWFNAAAPRVKSGAVDPERIDAAAAIALMLAEPILIRRPLVEANGERCAGFDREPVTSLLADAQRPNSLADNLEGCSRPSAAAPCPAPNPEHP